VNAPDEADSVNREIFMLQQKRQQILDHPQSLTMPQHQKALSKKDQDEGMSDDEDFLPEENQSTFSLQHAQQQLPQSFVSSSGSIASYQPSQPMNQPQQQQQPQQVHQFLPPPTQGTSSHTPLFGALVNAAFNADASPALVQQQPQPQSQPQLQLQQTPIKLPVPQQDASNTRLVSSFFGLSSSQPFSFTSSSASFDVGRNFSFNLPSCADFPASSLPPASSAPMLSSLPSWFKEEKSRLDSLLSVVEQKTENKSADRRKEIAVSTI